MKTLDPSWSKPLFVTIPNPNLGQPPMILTADVYDDDGGHAMTEAKHDKKNDHLGRCAVPTDQLVMMAGQGVEWSFPLSVKGIIYIMPEVVEQVAAAPPGGSSSRTVETPTRRLKTEDQDDFVVVDDDSTAGSPQAAPSPLPTTRPPPSAEQQQQQQQPPQHVAPAASAPAPEPTPAAAAAATAEVKEAVTAATLQPQPEAEQPAQTATTPSNPTPPVPSPAAAPDQEVTNSSSSKNTSIASGSGGAANNNSSIASSETASAAAPSAPVAAAAVEQPAAQQQKQEDDNIELEIAARCHGLKDADLFGKSDPYLVFRSTTTGEELYRTKVINDTLTPRWKDPILLTLPRGTNDFRVQIFDHDGKGEMVPAAMDKKNDPLGTVDSISVAELLELEQHDEWSAPIKDGKGALYLQQLRVTAVHQKDEAPPPNTTERKLLDGGDSSSSPSSSLAGIVSAAQAASSSSQPGPASPAGPPKPKDFANEQMSFLVHARCEGLKKADLFGKSDPYMLIHDLRDRSKLFARTEVLTKTLDPRWQSFHVNEMTAKTYVSITVFDDDQGTKDGKKCDAVADAKNELLGTAVFEWGDLIRLAKSDPQQEYVINFAENKKEGNFLSKGLKNNFITERTKLGSQKGKLFLRVEFVDAEHKERDFGLTQVDVESGGLDAIMAGARKFLESQNYDQCSLAPGETIWSDDGKFKFVFQTDGNVVLYNMFPDIEKNTVEQGNALWSTKTYWRKEGKKFSVFKLEDNGDLRLYDIDGKVCWSSKTGSNDLQKRRLMVLKNGNVVLVSAPRKPPHTIVKKIQEIDEEMGEEAKTSNTLSQELASENNQIEVLKGWHHVWWQTDTAQGFVGIVRTRKIKFKNIAKLIARAARMMSQQRKKEEEAECSFVEPPKWDYLSRRILTPANLAKVGLGGCTVASDPKCTHTGVPPIAIFIAWFVGFFVGFNHLLFSLLAVGGCIGWVMWHRKLQDSFQTKGEIGMLHANMTDSKSVEKVLGDKKPRWAACDHKTERVVWLDRVIAGLWPMVTKRATADLQAFLSTMLTQYCPGFLSKMSVDKKTHLGSTPIRIYGARLKSSTVDEGLVLDLDLVWPSNAYIGVNATTHLQLAIAAIIENVLFKATLQLKLKHLFDNWPCFYAMAMTLVGEPYIDLEMRAMKLSFDAVPGLESFLQNLIRSCVASSIQAPNQVIIPMSQDIPPRIKKLLSNVTLPVGLFVLTVEKAEGLKGELVSGAPSTYVECTIEPSLDPLKAESSSVYQKQQTRQVNDSYNPEYKSRSVFLSFNPVLESINMNVINVENLMKNPIIGKGRAGITAVNSATSYGSEFSVPLLPSEEKAKSTNDKKKELGTLKVFGRFRPLLSVVQFPNKLFDEIPDGEMRGVAALRVLRYTEDLGTATPKIDIHAQFSMFEQHKVRNVFKTKKFKFLAANNASDYYGEADFQSSQGIVSFRDARDETSQLRISVLHDKNEVAHATINLPQLVLQAHQRKGFILHKVICQNGALLEVDVEVLLADLSEEEKAEQLRSTLSQVESVVPGELLQPQSSVMFDED